jgi:hypothetical protein
MFPALQCSAARLQANMFGLDVLVGVSLVPPSLGRLLFPWAAVLTTLMPSTIELRVANAEAAGRMDIPLMTDRPAAGSATSTSYLNRLGAWTARPGVALVQAKVPAAKRFVADLTALWYSVLT